MKNAKAIWMLIVSIVLGLVVTTMAVVWVGQKGSVVVKKVVVAAMDIELGSRLTSQMLTTVDWPSGSTPVTAFTELKELQGRVVKSSVQRGEAILSTKLAPIGAQGGLSAVIAEGKRAITVRVNDVVGVAGFALPGNYVDIVVNTQQDRDSKGGENRQISMTVLKRVLVLAVAQEAGRDETKPKVVNAVTLELTPEDTEKLDLARNVGTLSLVLRNQVDMSPVNTGGVTRRQLLAAQAEPVTNAMPAVASRPILKTRRSITRARAPLALAAARHCVEVIHNSVRSVHCY